MSKNICFIASDLDGTLLNSKKEISLPTIENIKKLTRINKHFVMCSGRPLYRVKKYLDNVKVEGHSQYYIGINGSLIYEVDTNKIIYSATLTRKEANKVVKIAKENDVCVSIYTFDTVYTEKVSKYVIDNKIYEGVNFVLCDNLLTHQINDEIYKVLFVDDPLKIIKVREILSKEIYEGFSVVSSATHYVEFMNKDSSKGNAVKLLCKYLDINLENTLAFGDAENDLSMLANVMYSVAMLNGEKEVKDICKFITKSNEGDGVNYVLEKILKGEDLNEFCKELFVK